MMHRTVRSFACGAMAASLGLGVPTGCGPGSSPDPDARRVRFTYSVVVQDIPEGANDLSIWVPVPKTDRRQTVRDLKVSAPLEYTITHEKRYGNSMIHLAANAPLPAELELQFEAVIERQAYNVLDEEGRGSGAEKPGQDDLLPHELVPIDGIIAVLSRRATKDARTQLEKARAIYDYVTDEMTYEKSGEGWGRGDALYACDARTGNCTDFHSLIIGMARACGIPARFVMGFPLPEDRVDGEIPGYHCWAEMYIDDIGWLPVDSSEASKHPEKREAFFGGLDANRVQFTLGRDLKLVPTASEPLNYFVYPYVEVDGTKHSHVKRRFSFVEVKA
ncbi:MAG: transglutaminase-like domain-containing protein [Candidatus Krumholzibacteriia bacterium]